MIHFFKVGGKSAACPIPDKSEKRLKNRLTGMTVLSKLIGPIVFIKTVQYGREYRNEGA
jgi:hypothetical protein